MTEEKFTSPLDHDLEQYFAELAQFNSTKEMEGSELYRRIKPDVDRVLTTVVQENFASELLSEPSAVAGGISQNVVHAIAWNLERGNRFEGIADALKNHPQLREKDILMLTELDYGMARSKNRFVARELAQELKLNYAFVTCYIALQKGSGIESEVEGENTLAIHGLSMFSRYEMKNVHSVGLKNSIDKMAGKEKRLGTLRALFADIQHPAGEFRAVTLHTDAHSSRAHRVLQMKTVLDHLDTLPKLPVVIGGDWNTTTYNAQSARRAILGYWRRLMMGVNNVVKNHYPHPDRYFEKKLFRELEKRGYDYKSMNEIGACTLHYDVDNFAYNQNLGDWVPEWCFPWIFWALERAGGKCSLKLDWFAGKNIKAVGEPKVVGNLRDAEMQLSDHDAIVLDFVLDN
jgi:hypothetical protein